MNSIRLNLRPHSNASPHALSRAPRVPQALWVILVLALVARWAAAVTAGGEFRFKDEAFYVDAADRLVGGLGYDTEYLGVPAYPALLAFARGLAPESLLGIRLVQATVLAFGCLMCYQLGRRFHGELAGLAAAALYALDPLLIMSAALLYPESAALLALTAAVLIAWAAVERDGLSRHAVSGGLVGLVAMLRPVALAVVPVFILWLVLAPTGTWGRRIAYAAVFVGSCIAVLTPWTLRNYGVHGRLEPIATSGLGAVPGIGTEYAERGVGGAVVTVARRDPVPFLTRTLQEFGYFWEPYPRRMLTDDPRFTADLRRADPRLTGTPLVPAGWRDVASALSYGIEVVLAVVGVALVWRHGRRRRALLWLGALLLSFSLGYSLFFGKLRYRIPILPIVLAWAGAGAAGLAQLAGERGGVLAVRASHRSRSHQ